MKLLTMLATVLFFSQSTFAETNILTKNGQNLRMTNVDYKLVDMNLDAKRFRKNNMLLSLRNVSEKGLELNIMNDICPVVPGKPSCLAMPYPLFTAEFKLGSKKTDNCGVITQKSAVTNVKMGFSEKDTSERAQLIIRDYRYMTCEIMMKSELEIELNIKSKQGNSRSIVWLNKLDITDMPGINPPNIIVTPMPGKPVIPQERYLGAFATDVKGPFFSDATDLKAEITLDEQNEKIDLSVLSSACNGFPCEGFNVMISRELEIKSVKFNKCGEATYFTNSVSVYDAYPAVVGAIHTYVSLEIHDTRNSLCGNLEGTIVANVLVKQTRKYGLFPGPVVVSESQAQFQLDQIK